MCFERYDDDTDDLGRETVRVDEVDGRGVEGTGTPCRLRMGVPAIILVGELTEQFAGGGAVRRMRFVRAAERAQADIPTLILYGRPVGPNAGRDAVDSPKPCLGRGPAFIRAILGAGRGSEVGEGVVASVEISMVDLVRRPLARNVKPRKAMREVRSAADSDHPAPLLIKATGDRSNARRVPKLRRGVGINRNRAPAEDARLSVVVDDLPEPGSGEVGHDDWQPIGAVVAGILRGWRVDDE